MIANILQKLTGEAMKARDEIRVSTLRMLSSALAYERIETKKDLTTEEELVVIAKEAKKRKEAILAYKTAGATQKAKLEEAELKILQEFLPDQISDEELSQLISETIKQLNATGMQDMGKVIGVVKQKVGARAEGGRIANIVRLKLGQLE